MVVYKVPAAGLTPDREHVTSASISACTARPYSVMFQDRIEVPPEISGCPQGVLRYSIDQKIDHFISLFDIGVISEDVIPPILTSWPVEPAARFGRVAAPLGPECLPLEM